MKTVAVLLADGFEEIEAVVPSDILKRLGYEVITAGIKPGTVTGAHGIRATPQCGIADLDADSLDAVFLPGGMPGSTNLRDCPAVIALLRKLYESGKTVSAICAAPIVLHKAGITGERRVTGYPGSEQMAPGLVYTGSRAETDRNVVTGKGPGAAFNFASALATALGTTEEQLKTLKSQMIAL